MKLVWIAVLATGCAYRVNLVSQPTAATVELPGGDRVTTPAEVKLKWVPFGHQTIVVNAKGYRTFETDLRRTEIRWARFVFGTLAHPSVLTGAPRGEVDLVLVPDHGPVGSWSEEDIP